MWAGNTYFGIMKSLFKRKHNPLISLHCSFLNDFLLSNLVRIFLSLTCTEKNQLSYHDYRTLVTIHNIVSCIDRHLISQDIRASL